MTPLCNLCSKPTWTTDQFDEPLCASCQMDANEAAYERQQESLMESGGYPTLRDQQLEAYKIKRGLK